MFPSKNVKTGTDFLRKLGFSLVVCTETYSELKENASGAVVALKQQDSSHTFAQSSKKNESSPRIFFNFVTDNVDASVKELLESGCVTLDGPIQFTTQTSKTIEKIAALKVDGIEGVAFGFVQRKEK